MTLTEEFIEFLSNPENQNGFIWVMVSHSMLPAGVDGNNPRIIELCQKAERHYRERKQKREELTNDQSN